MTYSAHHIQVPRSARYFFLGDRAGADEIWFVLHGYGQLAAGFLRWFEPAARPGRVIVAPEGLSRAYFDEQQTRRVGASWMTKEDREAEIEDYVRYLDLLADELVGDLPPRARIQLHGFSQGVATACRWVAFGRHPVSRLVLWGGTVPPDLELERLRAHLRDARFVLAIGDRDPYIGQDMVRNEHARLLGVGFTIELRPFSGGHVVDQQALNSMAGVRVGA